MNVYTQINILTCMHACMHTEAYRGIGIQRQRQHKQKSWAPSARRKRPITEAKETYNRSKRDLRRALGAMRRERS